MKLKYFQRICAIAYIMVFSCLLTACGNTEDNIIEKDNSIQLNLENYSTYLDVKAGIESTGKQHKIFSDDYSYDSVRCLLQVEGVSTNFNYNNVIVKVKIAGTYRGYKIVGDGEIERFGSYEVFYEHDTIEDVDFLHEIETRCNISGDGSSDESVVLEYDTRKQDMDVAYEVVSVSGSVEPIN